MRGRPVASMITSLADSLVCTNPDSASSATATTTGARMVTASPGSRVLPISSRRTSAPAVARRRGSSGRRRGSRHRRARATRPRCRRSSPRSQWRSSRPSCSRRRPARRRGRRHRRQPDRDDRRRRDRHPRGRRSRCGAGAGSPQDCALGVAVLGGSGARQPLGSRRSSRSSHAPIMRHGRAATSPCRSRRESRVGTPEWGGRVA